MSTSPSNADIFLMAVPICHLRECFLAESALVGLLAAVHVDVVPYVVKLSVRLVAVLAYEELIRPFCVFICDEPFAIAEAAAIAVLINGRKFCKTFDSLVLLTG